MTIKRSLKVLEVLAIELEPPLIVDGMVSVSDTVQAMRDRQLGYALITDAEKLTGIFTERDVLLSVLDNNELLRQPVSQLMTPAPVCVHATETVWRVITLMHEGGFRQIPVVDDEQRVLACVRHKDIAEHLVNHFARHILNLPPDPEQVATMPEGA